MEKGKKAEEQSLCFKFVDEEVCVSDDFSVSGGMFDSLRVENAVFACRKKSSVCFSHNLENHIRCVVYLAIQKVDESLENSSPYERTAALFKTFAPVMTSVIDELAKKIDLSLIEKSNDAAWILVEEKIIFFLKNYCYKSYFDAADRYLRKKEITELVEKLKGLLEG